MPRKLLLAVTFAIAGIFLTAEFSVAAAKKKRVEKSDPALATVETVLRTEVAGEVDRRRQLAEAIEHQPDSPAARWQSGFVRDGNAWRSFDEQSPANAELLEEYRFHRADAPNTFPGQLDLANWCKKEGLSDQERVHLLAALPLVADVDPLPILQRLGYRQIANQWLSRDQIADWQDRNRRTAGALKRWGTRLEAIAGRIDGSQRQREAAVASLHQLTDPDAIAAMRYILGGRDEASALVAVDAFGRMTSYEATLALAEAAIFSKWGLVRDRATGLLKSRPLDDFVPDVIGLLALPATGNLSTQWYYFQDGYLPRGVAGGLVLRTDYIVARETDDQFQIAVLHTVDYRLNSTLNAFDKSVQFALGLNPPSKYRGDSPKQTALQLAVLRSQNDFARSQSADILAQEKLIDEINERSAELNRRVADVLAGVTSRDATTDAATWWQWWADFSDTQKTGGKTVVTVSEDSVSKGDPRIRVRFFSCFAAGTPVWTERGPAPIESIKPGDRVLSKDVETGELVYKPVLQTTVRPPKELTTLRFGNETIVCTGGHRFWSSGSGWIKARDLAPQTLLHTVTGNTPVWTAKKGESAQTYNLVVADFHTYFVGKQGILCQDLLIPRGTHSVVPGLSRSSAVAQTKK